MRSVAGLAGVALALGACVTPRPADDDRPYIRVLADVKAAGPSCPREHPIDIVRGPVPDGMVVITAASSSAVNGMRASLEMHEVMARRLALRFCADGLSVLTATENDGVVESTTLVLWRRPPKPGAGAPPAEDSSSPSSPSSP